ncbi:DUF488 family protein [Candidatus Caldatribacterium saccharofermentans]|uniref:DUF488 domain-containing protein n=1 Tax=Candidatus Caldatribacterium saccharofermentans TaxID=1454753 RepID=UPI003D03B43A
MCTVSALAGKVPGSFFGKLEEAGIKRVIDVRLHNASQLAGFTKREDLQFFLERILCAEYRHEPLFAPTGEMLRKYRTGQYSWEDYEKEFLALLRERAVEQKFSPDLFALPTVLLCSEASPTHCHRRLILEYLRGHWGGLEIVHL